MIVAVVVFGLSRSFWLATMALWAAAAVWEVSEPVLAAWVNRGLDPRTRATVNSLASQAHAVGEVAGGPTFGTIAVLTSTPTALVCAGLVQLPSVVLLARRRRTAMRIDGTVPADAAAAE
jgi:DHA3 family tetracycline resistance protein-like MFS transporter